MNKTSIPEIENAMIPKRREGFSLEKTPCCYFLRREENKSLIKLNDSSVIIWQACTGEWSVGDIIAALEESYPESAESMGSDVHSALDELSREGVIELSEPVAA